MSGKGGYCYLGVCEEWEGQGMKMFLWLDSLYVGWAGGDLVFSVGSWRMAWAQVSVAVSSELA